MDSVTNPGTASALLTSSGLRATTSTRSAVGAAKAVPAIEKRDITERKIVDFIVVGISLA